jgi:hypothetical protein
MLTIPVASLHMVRSLVAGISEGSGLLGCEVPSLDFSDLVQLLLPLIRSLHNKSTFLIDYATVETVRQVPTKFHDKISD